MKAGHATAYGHTRSRSLLTLAIETSCDDTSVAILEKHDNLEGGRSGALATVHFHEKVTANNDAYSGIHPLVALESHQTHLAPLVQKAIRHLPTAEREKIEHARKPDFVSVTRGPGMRSNLSVGLDTAKGLALAWNVPLLGVHHMQAHALTPRLVHALEYNAKNGKHTAKPAFPFLSVLVSGGHSLLVLSSGLTKHSILAETGDIALGDCLDKAARATLPPELLKTPYGKALEDFAFPNGAADYNYIAPRNRGEELERKRTKWGWSLGAPMAESKGEGKSSRKMAYSFAGLLSSVERFMKFELNSETGAATQTPRPNVSIEERRDLAREIQRVAFEHLSSRILLFLHPGPSTDNFTTFPRPAPSIDTIVVSGGVASSRYLRHVLRSMLDARGQGHVEVSFPPIELCTDNALMIAWAGMEMWEAGFRSELGVRPVRKWSLDSEVEGGGVLGVGGWLRA